MANLNLKHIYKVYPNGAKAVSDFTMDISDKEFIVFVGPSGCGKSTTLRMIAGLEEITAGELRIGDVVVNDAEPKERDIAMVFQNYALYPHMSIYDNIAFGLTMRKIPTEVVTKSGKKKTVMRHMSKEDINARVEWAAKILGIEDLLKRKPKEMSGGQRQRVALGRAIVREPKVMLLDEPLSNLDAKLRTQMRSEIIKLHEQLQTTFIYVTHDQVEAMTMGTRIVVMKDGFVQQMDAPKNLYLHPNNMFVAGFIGTPQMNFLKGRIVKKEEGYAVTLDVQETSFLLPERLLKRMDPLSLSQEKEIVLGIRPENVHFEKEEGQEEFSLRLTVSHNEELGTETLTYGTLGEGEEAPRLIVKSDAFASRKPGSVAEVYVDIDAMHLFDAESERSLIPCLPQKNFLPLSVGEKTIKMLGKNFPLLEMLPLPKGKGKAILPLSAFVEGEEIQARIISQEEIDGAFLCEAKAGEETFFLLRKEEAGEEVSFAIDWTKADFLFGDTRIDHLDLTSSFLGKIEMKKERLADSKAKKSKIKNLYSFRFLDASFPMEEALAKRIFGAYRGRKAFHVEFKISFAPEAVLINQGELKATIKSLATYGHRHIATLEVAGKEIFADTLGKEYRVDEEVTVGFDLEKASLVETERDIQIL